MKIWVDADACPGVVKEILFKAAQRIGLQMTLVANHRMRIPRSPYLHFIQVPAGFDKADSEIVKQLAAGDLVITADIPLAAAVIEKQGLILTPRGERYTAENIRARLSLRDFMETLRDSGVETGGPPPLSNHDRKAFAGQLDKLLAQLTRASIKRAT